jgi:tetratricopeptide (TPR) repeat protein
MVAAIVLAVIVAPVIADGAQRRMSIARGKIVDQDGNPIAGVSVSIEFWYLGPRLGISATADGSREQINQTDVKRSAFDIETKDDGTFSHPDLIPDTEYRVRLERDGYIPRELKHVFRVAVNDLGTMVLVSGDVEAARDAYDRGYAAFEARQFPQAIEAMGEVVEVYGDSDSSDQMFVVALGVLGQGYLQMGQPAEAEQALQRLMEIRPGDAIAHRGLGQVRAMKGEMAAAIDHFDVAVQIEPDNPTGRYLLGFALQLTGRSADAIEHLEACLKVRPGYVQAHKSLGMAYADTGKNDEAIQHLEAYLKAAPNAPDAAEVQAKLDELRLDARS